MGRDDTGASDQALPPLAITRIGSLWALESGSLFRAVASPILPGRGASLAFWDVERAGHLHALNHSQASSSDSPVDLTPGSHLHSYSDSESVPCYCIPCSRQIPSRKVLFHH